MKKHILSNHGYELYAEAMPDGMSIQLMDKKGSFELTDLPYEYTMSYKDGNGVVTVGPMLENVSVESGADNESIRSSGTLGPMSIIHTFWLPADKDFMEERITLKNTSKSAVQVTDLEAGMLYRFTDERGSVLPSLQKDRLIAVPLRHRAESEPQNDEDFSFEDLLTSTGRIRTHFDPWGGEMPSLRRHAEGWLWQHGPCYYGFYKFNQQNMEFSVLTPVVKEDGVYVRFGGSAMIDGNPAFLTNIGPGEQVSLGVTRYVTVGGSLADAYYCFRDFLDENGCCFPKDFNPPIHWNELYDNPEWNVYSPSATRRPASTRKTTYTRELIVQEAAKAREYSCQSLYLDPGWDTAFASFLWGEEWLGPMGDFVRTIKTDYGLGVSLHCPLATWMSMDGTGVFSWPKESFIKDKHGNVLDGQVCLGSSQYLDEAEKRLLALCEQGVVFLMFDGNWYNRGCWDPNHGHPVPFTKEDSCSANFDLAQRIHKKYPDVLIEMHDMVCGGSRYRYTPVYYKYGLPGSYDDNWGFELMWQTMEDILSGRARSLYYYNLGCNVPMYLHIDLRDDNRHCLVLWWYASTCRHLGIGGTHEDPYVAEAQKAAMRRYRRLERFFKRGIFYGLAEDIHLHVLPEEGAFVVNLFNMSDTSRLMEISIPFSDLKLDTSKAYIMPKGCRIDPESGNFVLERRLEPWGAQVAEIMRLEQ